MRLFSPFTENNESFNFYNNPNGFFFYGNMGPEFRKMWNDINSGQDFTESMKEYMNIDDIMKEWSKNNSKPKNPMNNRRPMKKSQPAKTTTTFSREDYENLIEIRGYLNITEQRAHVKALDKLLSQIVMVPIDPKEKP